MADCCNSDKDLVFLIKKQRQTLTSVFYINVIMLFVIAGGAFYSYSSALFADSLDNLGDALTYGLSLYVLSCNPSAKAWVALLKGGIIFLGALIVALQVMERVGTPLIPLSMEMAAFCVLSLIANATCLYLLWRHRNDDINMGSVWECSRNDIVSNTSVLVTAGLVGMTQSAWPDLILAVALVIFLMRSSSRVIHAAVNKICSKSEKSTDYLDR